MEIAIAIAFAGVSLAAAFLALKDARRIAPRPASAGGADAPAPFAVLDAGGGVTATPAARALLGLSRPPTEPRGLAAAVALGAEEFAEALGRLAERGVAFRQIIETSEGRLVEAAGSPVGAEAAVVFTDQTGAIGEARLARAALREAQEELNDLRTAHRLAGVFSWRSDPSGAVRWRSEGFADLAVPTRRALIEAAADRARRSDRAETRFAGAPDALEDVIETPEGDRAFAVAAVARDEEGGALHVAADVGAVVRSERAMERLIDTMSATFAHLKVGLMIFDRASRLVLFNPAIIETFGLSGEELARRPELRAFLDGLRRDRKLPERLDYAEWRERIMSLADAPDPAPFEEIWHLADGRSLMALFRPHGSGGLAFVVEDVTEAMALRRSSSSVRAVSRATTDMLEEGVAVFGPDGRLSVANGALKRIWGFGPEDAAAERHVSELVERWEGLSGPSPFWGALLGAATHGRERVETAHKLELRDGRLLAARLSPMPDGSTLAVFSDATATERVAAALKERNEALERADEMRSGLIDQIAHQMRTPLNSVIGLGQLLADPRFGELNDTQRDYVEGIVESSNDLLNAINGMSDLITVGAKLEEEEAAPVDVVAALEEVVAVFARRLKDRAPKVEVDCGDLGEDLQGPADQLRQIASHMLMDAAAKSPEGAPLRLSLAIE
ncbi:MAG: PAS-domain containing protein, partial [Pseudomonadota bacterium]